TSPSSTAPTAAIVISVPTPILPLARLRSVEGTNVHPATASAAALSTRPARSGALAHPAPYPSPSRTAATAANRISLTCHSRSGASSSSAPGPWSELHPQASLTAHLPRLLGLGVGSVGGAQGHRVAGRGKHDLGRSQ